MQKEEWISTMQKEEWITLPKFRNGFDRIPLGTWVRIKNMNMLAMEKKENVDTIEKYDTKTEIYFEDVMTLAFRKNKTTKIYYKKLPPTQSLNRDMNRGAVLPFGLTQCRNKMLEGLRNCANGAKAMVNEYMSMAKEAELEQGRLFNLLTEETVHKEESIVIQKICLMVGNAYAKQCGMESFDFQLDGQNLLNFISQALQQKIPQDVSNFGLKNESPNRKEIAQNLKSASDSIKVIKEDNRKTNNTTTTTCKKDEETPKRPVKTRRNSPDARTFRKKLRFTNMADIVAEPCEKTAEIEIQRQPTEKQNAENLSNE